LLLLARIIISLITTVHTKEHSKVVYVFVFGRQKVEGILSNLEKK